MKKILFTFIFALTLVGLKANTNADTVVVFDPANGADTAGIAAQGFSIAKLNGTPYLKVVVNGWNTNLLLNHVVTLPAGNLYTFNTLSTVAKVVINPSDTFVHAGRNLFIQPFDTSAAAYSFSLAVTTPLTLSKITGGTDSRGYVTNKIQIAIQGRAGTWPALVGDTLYLGKLVSFHTSLPTNAAAKYDTINNVDDFDVTDPTNDNIWSDNSTPSIINNLATGSATGAATGTFQALWNKDYIYFNAKITDANPVAYTGSNPWNNDGIELYLDPNGLHFTGQRISFQHQIRFNFGTDTITGAPVSPLAWNKYGYPTTDLGTVIFQQTTIAGGYDFIIKIPWYALWMSDTTHTNAQFLTDSTAAAGLIASGKEISFEIAVINNNSAGTAVRTSIMNWANNSGHDTAYLSSGMWGSLILKGGPTAVPSISRAKIGVYPNPVTEKLTVSADGLKELRIVSIVGQEVSRIRANSDLFDVDVQNLKTGVYILQVTTSKGTFNSKFIKK